MNKKIDKEVVGYLTSKIKDIIENRGLDTSRMREVLSTLVKEEKIRSSHMDLGIVTVSVSDLKPLELYKEDIPEGMMVSYLMASANLPVFKIEPIEGKFYIDGAFYDNCPINMLVRKGYKEIIAIRTFGIGLVRKIEDENVKVINIVPSEDLGNILNFDNQLIQNNLKMGYYDAMRAIKGLKGKKYYIESGVRESTFLYSLLALPKKSIKEIGEMMGLPQMEPKRMLLERIVPEAAHMLSLPVTATYQDIILGILEGAAKEREIERYKIRKFSSFVEEIKATESKEKNSASSLILNIAGKTKLKSVFAKEMILKKIEEELLGVLRAEKFE
jgi:NTE family protein